MQEFELTACLNGEDGDTLRIGDNIELMVVAVNGKQARIGITAPRDVNIFREELYLNKKALEAKKIAVAKNGLLERR